MSCRCCCCTRLCPYPHPSHHLPDPSNFPLDLLDQVNDACEPCGNQLVPNCGLYNLGTSADTDVAGSTITSAELLCPKGSDVKPACTACSAGFHAVCGCAVCVHARGLPGALGFCCVAHVSELQQLYSYTATWGLLLAPLLHGL